MNITIQHPTGAMEIRGLGVNGAQQVRSAIMVLASAAAEEQTTKLEKEIERIHNEWKQTDQERADWKKLAEDAKVRVEAHVTEMDKLMWSHRDLSNQLDECRGQLDEYRGQGGMINMERSWKSKYRNALAEANQRLIDAGLDPVRIRKELSGTEEATSNGPEDHR